MGTWLEKLIPLEKRLLDELSIPSDQKLKHPVIAIGGLSGTGKDTLAANLKPYVENMIGKEVQIMSAGRIIRNLAGKQGYHEADMDHFVTTIQDSMEFREQIDLMVDKSMLKMALEKGGIFVGRMAPFAIGDWGLTIYLKCNPSIVARRLITDPKRAERGKDYENVKQKIINRDKADQKRLGEFYEASFDELIKKVNIVIDTGVFSAEGVFNIAKAATRDYLEKRWTELEPF